MEMCLQSGRAVRSESFMMDILPAHLYLLQISVIQIVSCVRIR